MAAGDVLSSYISWHPDAAEYPYAPCTQFAGILAYSDPVFQSILFVFVYGPIRKYWKKTVFVKEEGIAYTIIT
jgi:hypothetical protein